MKILTVPNVTLRQTSQTVTGQERHLSRFIDQVLHSLDKSAIGVGLAAPQLGLNYRLLATKLPLSPTSPQKPVLTYYLNPTIITHSQEKATRGSQKKTDDLEGCLSVPNIYAPILRYVWIELAYQQLENNQLVDKKIKLTDFAARVLQHEIDHLDGILFVDHMLAQNQPLFQDINGQLKEITREKFYQIFGQQI